MTPKECKTCKWRGGREMPGSCGVNRPYVSGEQFAWQEFEIARSKNGPCGPDTKLYEPEEK